ncbi:TPA: hypothetical protein ACH3X1_002212 [Trebouxia sp. C0004]
MPQLNPLHGFDPDGPSRQSCANCGRPAQNSYFGRHTCIDRRFKRARTVQSATIDAAPSRQSSFGPGIEGATAVPPQEFADQTDGQAIESSASDILQSGQESPRPNSLEHASAQALSGQLSQEGINWPSHLLYKSPNAADIKLILEFYAATCQCPRVCSCGLDNKCDFVQQHCRVVPSFAATRYDLLTARSCEIFCFDALGGHNDHVITNLLDWLGHEQLATKQHASCRSKHATQKPPSEWRRRSIAHPQQFNDFDCGVFTLMFASQLAFSLDLQFIQQSDMPEFRHFVVASIHTEREPGILLHSFNTNDAASGADYSSQFDLDGDSLEASPGCDDNMAREEAEDDDNATIDDSDAPMLASPNMYDCDLLDALDVIEQAAEDDGLTPAQVGDQPVESLTGSNLLDILDYMHIRDTELAAQQLQKDWHKQLFDDAPSTLLQTVYERLHSQIYGRSRDGASDIECRAHAVLYQPRGSLYPKSRHRMKKILGVLELSAVEEHVCVNECCHYKKLPPSEWVHHIDEECACGERRFKIVFNGPRRRPTLVPRKKFWYFGLARIIGDVLFGNSVWCGLRRICMHQPQSGHDFRSSPEFARLDSGVSQKAGHPDSGLYQVGFDFGQMFTFRAWSSGIISIRCSDIPAMHRNKREFTPILAVIPRQE